MNLIHAIFLGAIQGVTEFLPISSSGHLVFFQHLFGYQEPLIAFDVVVHLGTLVALVGYFWKDLYLVVKEGIMFLFHLPKIKSMDRYFFEHTSALVMGYILLTMSVTFGVAIVFKETIHSLFGSVLVVGIAWIVMGFFLIASRKIQTNYRRDFYQMTHRDSFLIGLAQGFALIPGISRAGTTIIAGMACGLENQAAARFSFLLGFFAILGAGILEAKEGIEFFQEAPAALIAGFITAAIVGYVAIFMLMKLLEKGKFFVFGFYCIGMGILTFVLIFLGIL